MKNIMVMIIALGVAACASKDPNRLDLVCSEARQCAASLEQHPGQPDWYIVIDTECGIVQTADGEYLPICNGERWVGNGDVEIKSGSCRACERIKP